MKQWTISTSLSVNYSIITAPNLFSHENNQLGDFVPNKRTVVVIDKLVYSIYFESVIGPYFIHHKINAHYVVIDGTESNKNSESLYRILDEIENFGLLRRDPVIAIGGGVIQDLVGLASNLYRRGLPYIRIPTTLLGIVDVSVAAKTGINFKSRRNRLGSYYPPTVCFLDRSFLQTLDPKEISSGMGEILKMAVIKDSVLFEILKKHSEELLSSKFEHKMADEVITRSVQGMVEELENNLWEKDLKRCVDFGHSFSPIIEMRSLGTNNPLAHGEAVTLDVIFSCRIAKNRGLITQGELTDVINTAISMGLPIEHPLFSDASLIYEGLMDTVKHRAGNQNLPVPNKKIGEYIFLNDVDYSEIVNIVDSLQSQR